MPLCRALWPAKAEVRVLLVGSWPQAPAGTRAILAEIATGITEQCETAVVDTLVLGGGADFRTAVEQVEDHQWCPIVAGQKTPKEVAHAVLDAYGQGKSPLIEAGHPSNVDAGIGMLEVLADMSLPRDQSLVDTLPVAIEAARERLVGREFLVAASTRRPLLGLDSVMAVTNTGEPRPEQDRAATGVLTRAWATVRLPEPRSLLPLSGTSQTGVKRNVARMSGSGAGGGIGAVAMALGGRAIPTGDLLVSILDVQTRCADVDLVAVVETHLHSPLLAESSLEAVARAAAHHALPVVALGAHCSLSAHERAQWGIHGVLRVDDDDSATGTTMRGTGRRLARTWLPR